MTTSTVRVLEPSRFMARGLSRTPLALHTHVVRWARSTWCLMNGGHFKLLHAEPSRLALKCVACGHESPGWSVGPRARES